MNGAHSVDSATSAPPPHLLVVEPDNELRELFAQLLSEEGYATTLVRTVEQAVTQLDEHTFALILVNLSMKREPDTSTGIHTLRQRAYPTPLGVLSTQQLMPEVAPDAGFAFVVHLPFDLDAFLTQIASTLARPFSDEQRHQLDVIARYLAAIEVGDAAAQAATCREDAIFYPPSSSAVTTDNRLMGRPDVQAYFEACNARYRLAVFEEVLPYVHPKGIALHYTANWVTDDDVRQRATAVALFHFKDDSIS